MAKIEVNHQFLRTLAEDIDAYCKLQNREMRTADSHVKTMLADSWQGQDALEFSSKWEEVDDADSTTVKFRENLQGFSEALVACADQYQRAQEDSYNQACRLPKYLYW